MKKYDLRYVNKIYDLWENEFHLKRTIVNGEECFEKNGEYLRLDTFVLNNERQYCIEWAINREDAEKNFFEDAWLYGEQLGVDVIISEMRDDLRKDLSE